MSNNKLLITSALPHFLGTSEELYLLGTWCTPYNFEKNLENRVYNVQPHHWSDYKKKIKDYDYIKGLYERVVCQLSESLNHHHGVNYSHKYWRIVLGPWLISYLPLIWDRWETLRVAFKNNAKFSTKTYKVNTHFTPSSFEEYSTVYTQSDAWNHFVFLDIIKSQYSSMVDIEVMEQRCESIFETKRTKLSLGTVIRRLINNALSLIDFNSKVFIYESQLSKFNLLKMSIYLRQIPKLNNFINPASCGYSNTDMNRNSIFLNLFPLNNFEKYLEKRIVKDIPLSIVENFKEISLDVNKKQFKGEIIFTSNAHLSDDAFNIWAANQVVLHNKKLITSQHGGAIKSLISVFDHQEKISDIHAVWHKPYKENHMQMPPLKNFTANLDVKRRKNLLLVGYETGNYIYNAQSGPTCDGLLEDYNQKIEFIESIDLHIRKSLKIKSKSFGPGYFCSMDRYTDSLGNGYHCAKGIFADAIKEARVIVCTYPQTTFSESIISGVPTILLMVEEKWPLSKEFSSLIETLYKNNIIFYDYLSAAKHINKVWSNPYDWWNSPSLVRAKECFYDECCHYDENRVSAWSEFLLNELHAKN